MEVGVKQILGKSFQKCVPKKLDPPSSAEAAECSELGKIQPLTHIQV